jgi:TPR repeat protein
MQAFCREARRFAAVNPALGTLDAYIVAYEDVHVAAQAGDRKRILELLDQAVRQGAEVFGDRASELYIQGQYREAVADTDRVLEIAPNDVAALETRAMCLYYLGQRQQALEVLTTALDLEPTNDTALGFRARIREESKQFDEALKDYEKALSVRPYGVGLWTQKGRLLLEALGRKSEGEAACAHAVELDGEDAEALYCHGLALAARSDPAAGATLERALAGSTDTRLCTDLAYRYASGLLVPQDQARATSLFTRAAEKGDALAESNLGFRYYDGLGTRRDYAMAVKWWRAAADQGESHAMSGLGTAYAFGNGVGRDPREAARLFRASWEAGYAHGAFNLALSYWRGQGVARDLVTAYVLLNRAATAGDTEAPAKIPSLLREMTPQQIEEGKRRLAEADGHRAP